MKLHISISLILILTVSASGQLTDAFKESSSIRASQPKSSGAALMDDVIKQSNYYFEMGEQAIKSKYFYAAKGYFDMALSEVEKSGVQISSNSQLTTYYSRIKRKISEYETMYELNAPRPSDFDPSKPVAAPKLPDVITENVTVDAGAPPKQLKTGVTPIILKYLNDNLNDPYSAKYLAWSKPSLRFSGGSSVWVVTVRLRVKNLFNAYVLGEAVFHIRKNRIVSARMN